jgi:phage-related protein
MKPVTFLGNSLEVLRKFPEDARHDAGYQLDFKPVPTIGRGVEEIRIWTDEGTFRVLYVARLAEAVYVLHAFQKKTQAIPRGDLDLAQSRCQDLQAERRKKPKP